MLLARHMLAVLQEAIDPIADAETLFEGLDMNVRGLALHGFRDDAVDDAHDRRLACEITKTLDVVDRIEIAGAGASILDEITGDVVGADRGDPAHLRYQRECRP